MLQEWVQARGLGLPDLHRRLARGPAACAGICRDGERQRLYWLRRRRQQARGRTDCGAGSAAGTRRVTSGSSPVAGSRCGFVAVAGAPNAGKSTLVNRLAGAKLSIVTPKAQTTRFRVLGIMLRGVSQVLLVDTPGIFTPRRRLDRAMVAAAWTGVRDADLTLLLVDAKDGATEAVRRIAATLAEQQRRSWLVLNKVDLDAGAASCCR